MRHLRQVRAPGPVLWVAPGRKGGYAMFKEMLQIVIEHTERRRGALIMGTDGIAVEKVFGVAGKDANLDVAAAEFTSLVGYAQRAGNDTGLGDLRELVIFLDQTVVVMRLLSREYFVVLALSPEGNLGRGRFELRKAELQLAKEFTL
jgi:predicted regulator of Ras-like GTPase activity (Roadblock/LC7/MglB family)